MKLLVSVTLALLATAVQPQEYDIDFVETYMKNVTDTWKSYVYEHIIEEDGSAYKPFAQAMIDWVEPQFCPSEDLEGECVASETWLFGCYCRGKFNALGKHCGALPCRAFQLIKTYGVQAMHTYFSTDSYEVKSEVAYKFAMKPLLKLLCECPGAIKAERQCAQNYDGDLYISATFKDVVKHVDLRAVQHILEGALEGICGEHKGENCLDQAEELAIKFGALLDNTFSGQDTCNSMVRAKEEIAAYLTEVLDDEDAYEDMDAYLRRVVDADVEVQRKMTCDAECADEVQQTYYNSCCIKRYMERVTEPDMRENYLKLSRSMAKLYDVEELPNLKQTHDKYFTMYDPANFCGAEVDAYSNFNEQCDAIAA